MAKYVQHVMTLLDYHVMLEIIVYAKLIIFGTELIVVSLIKSNPNQKFYLLVFFHTMFNIFTNDN